MFNAEPVAWQVLKYYCILKYKEAEVCSMGFRNEHSYYRMGGGKGALMKQLDELL